MRQREVINEYIDLIWERGKPRIYVAGKPFLYCSFLVVKVDPTDQANEGITVEQLAERPGATALEGEEAVGKTIDGYTLTQDDVMLGFTSSLRGWVEHDFMTEALGANLSFPLLKELARVGDKKAQRVLQSEIIKRLKEGHRPTTIVVLETCMDVIDADTSTWIVDHLIKPKLADEDSPELETMAGLSELNVPIGLALLRSASPHVRRMASWRVKKLGTLFMSKQDLQVVMSMLRTETNTNVIRELSGIITDASVSAALITTLIKQVTHFMRLASQTSRYADPIDKAIDAYSAMAVILQDAPVEDESLAEIMAFARFRSMVDIEDTMRWGVDHIFTARRKLQVSVLETHRAPSAAVEQAIESLEKLEGFKSDLLVIWHAARALRNAITAEPAAGPLPMELKVSAVYHYDGLRISRTRSGWTVSGHTAAGSGPMARARHEEELVNDHEVHEFFKYTGLQPKDSQDFPLLREGEGIALKGVYTLQLYSGTWMGLQLLATKLGAKAARMTLEVPMLHERLYETVYYKDGTVFQLDGNSKPATQLWKHVTSKEGAARWQPMAMSKGLAGYFR